MMYECISDVFLESHFSIPALTRENMQSRSGLVRTSPDLIQSTSTNSWESALELRCDLEIYIRCTAGLICLSSQSYWILPYHQVRTGPDQSGPDPECFPNTARNRLGAIMEPQRSVFNSIVMFLIRFKRFQKRFSFHKTNDSVIFNHWCCKAYHSVANPRMLCSANQ